MGARTARCAPGEVARRRMPRQQRAVRKTALYRRGRDGSRTVLATTGPYAHCKALPARCARRARVPPWCGPALRRRVAPRRRTSGARQPHVGCRRGACLGAARTGAEAAGAARACAKARGGAVAESSAVRRLGCALFGCRRWRSDAAAVRCWSRHRRLGRWLVRLRGQQPGGSGAWSGWTGGWQGGLAASAQEKNISKRPRC